MANLEDVSKAVIARLRPVLPDWETLWYTPVSPPVPSLCLRPDDNRHVEYQFRPPKWLLRAGLTVSAEDEEAAYSLLSSLTGSDGLLIARFLDEDLRDDLWDICGLDRSVIDGRRWKMGRQRRLSCDIGLMLGVN